MRIFIVFTLILTILGCDKPNPEPEKLDPIYSEMEKEASAAGNALKAAEKELEGFEKELAAVVPQTGQIKYAQKRVSETQAKITKLRQMEQYWKLRVESRKVWAREKYLEAYHQKKPWPPPEEFTEYQAQKKLEEAPRAWDLKGRLEQAKLGISLKSREKKEEKAETQ